MRAVGTCKRMLDMACERALSRETQGELLANKQMTQEKIVSAAAPFASSVEEAQRKRLHRADCWTMLEEFSEHSHRLYLVSPRGLLTQTVAANRAPRASSLP